MTATLIIDPDTYLTSLQEGKSVRITYKRFLMEDLLKVYDIIEEWLVLKNQHKLVSFTKTVVKEMVQNAVKATQKRYFFQKQGLDIQKDYVKGMEFFSEFMQENKNNELPPNFLFTAQLTLESIDGFLYVLVRNHGEMTEVENHNVQQMFQRGKRLNSVAELLEDEVKHKEGGGIGLSMIIVLSKSLGLPFPLSYTCSGGFTEFCLKLPANP
jgi:hypothetical protein